MCLKLREIDSDKPYIDGNIRWKIAEIIETTNEILSAFVIDRHTYKRYKYDTIGEKNIAEIIDNLFFDDIKEYSGFHVFIDKEDCRNQMRDCQSLVKKNREKLVLLKVNVDNFIKSGICEFFPKSFRNCETWKEMTILEVYDINGNDITDKFRKLVNSP